MSMSASGVPCPSAECASMQLAPSEADFIDYFEGRQWACSACGTQMDLWTLLLARVLDDHPLMPGVVSLGLAAFTVISAPLLPGGTLFVDFASHGIPGDATVVDVVMTPQT